jgi:hypothetical protein
MTGELSGKAAIVGIGATDFSKNSGRSELRLAAEAPGDGEGDEETEETHGCRSGASGQTHYRPRGPVIRSSEGTTDEEIRWAAAPPASAR